MAAIDRAPAHRPWRSSTATPTPPTARLDMARIEGVSLRPRAGDFLAHQRRRELRIALRHLSRRIFDDAFDLIIGQRCEHRQAAGANPKRMPVTGLQHVGADGEGAFLPMQANRMQVASHRQEAAILRGLGQPPERWQSGAMNPETLARHGAEHEGFRSEMVYAGSGILQHQPVALQSSEQTMRGGPCEPRSLDEVR